MNIKKFIAELKRRNVFKVATAYAIVGWLIIQVVTSIKEPLSLPNWFDTIIIILVLVGFPIVLIIAWAFELTPEGLKKTEQVKIEESKTKDTGKTLNRVIIGVLLVLIAFLAFDRIFYDHHTEDDHSITKSLPSIAVLPFADMSPKNDQEYFSDDLSEELLNVLAKVKDMKVAGRTSSFKFKGKNDDLKMIGKELGVEHILEGSVRKSGDKIRITAQLIKVSDGFHMWSETYDRDYNTTNLFKIQDEISKEVLRELKITLLNDSLAIKEISITNNTEAYEAYLKGNKLLVNRNPKEIEQAIKEFEKAIAFDKDFAMAYAKLSIAYYHYISYAYFDQEKGSFEMRKNADKALLLNNTLGIAYAALGHYYTEKSDFDNAILALKKAYELDPNDAEIVMWYASRLPFRDDKELKTKLYKEAYEKDPLAPIVINNLAMDYRFNGDYEKAQQLIEENVRINPNYITGRIAFIDMLANEPNGKLDEAFIATYKAYTELPNDLKILEALYNYAIVLNINYLAEELNTKIQKLYPNNPGYNNYIKAAISGDRKEIVIFFYRSYL